MKAVVFLLLSLSAAAYSQSDQPNINGFPFTYSAGLINGGGDKAHGVVVDDVDNDGKAELIVLGSVSLHNADNAVFVYDYLENETVSLKFRLDITYDDDEQTTEISQYAPAVCDADGDGFKEIVVPFTYSTRLDVCGNADECCAYFSKVFTWEIIGESTVATISSPFWGQFGTPIVADVFGEDGDDELVFMGPTMFAGYGEDPNDRLYTSLARLYVLNWDNNNWASTQADGYEIARWSSELESFMVPVADPALGDLNLDGFPEIFVLVPSDASTVPSEQHAKLKVFDLQASPNLVYDIEFQGLLDRPSSTSCGFENASSLVLADLNGDSHLEAIVPVLENGLPSVAVVKFYPSLNTSNLRMEGGTFDPMSSLAIGDVLGEGYPIVFVPTHNRFNTIRFQGGQFRENSFELWPKPLAGTHYSPCPSAISGNASGDVFVVDTYLPGDLSVDMRFFTVNDDLDEFIWDDVSDNTESNPTGRNNWSSNATDLDLDGEAELLTTIPLSDRSVEIQAIDMNIPYRREHNEWVGYRNGPRHTGLYAQPVTWTQKTPSEAVWQGRVIVHDTYRINNGSSLTILPGTVVEFRPGARLWIDGGTFKAEGNTTDSIFFLPDVDGEQWEEILVTAGIFDLSHTVIRGARHGLMLSGVDDTHIDNCRIQNCDYGISSNLTGRFYLRDSEISDCDQSGLFVADGASIVDNCIVRNCGNGTFPFGVAFHWNHAAIRCSEIFENTGPGVFSVQGLLVMSYDYAYRGGGLSYIHNNSWDRGELEFANSALAMRNGGNFFDRDQSFSEILITNSSFDPQVSELTGNVWPTFVEDENYLLDNCVEPETAFTCGPYSPTSFSGCDFLDAQITAEAVETWNNALEQLSNSAPAGARDSLKHLIRVFDESTLALHAPGLFVAASRLNEDALDTIIDTLEALREHTSVPELQLKIREAQATALALADEADAARDSVFSILADVSSSDDSLSARLLLAEIDLFDYFMTSELPSTFDEEVSMYIARVDSIVDFYYKGVVFKPTMIWDDVSSLEKTAYSHTISTEAFADDAVPVEFVFIDYRILPNQDWVHDTLTQQANDTTWEITLTLDSLGGGLEYRLVAKDTLGRFETQPGTEGYPNLNDTLNHFVSFEPRLTVPLTDTAYVYAPGVITENITIGDGGVLYVLPAPVELDCYVLEIDSGVGITLAATETQPKLVIDGTDSTVIQLVCADSLDRWTGITALGGNVSADYAKLREVTRPILTDRDGTYPTLRFSNVSISDFALPAYLEDLNATESDSSYLLDCIFEDGDSSGVVISTGALDMSDVTVRDCADDGIVLFEAMDQLLGNVRITDNGGFGLVTESSVGSTARLSNCYVAFNGDTLPEIKVNSNSSIDVSDYAGNVVKDSTGVLFECAEVNDFDAELGSNSFVLADSMGKYFNVTAMAAPAYITGNTFYPESVNDSTFIDEYMKHDTLSKWVYSYLRAEDQMGSVIEDPNGSIDFELKAYVQNYLGTVANDTITQVGFKYRVFPDSTNWTTLRQNTIETDSIYNWTVSVGDQGGLISYIWWAKDKHGRYLTSPAGADTTTPDSGATHFLSFEMSDVSIVNDSVTIWAPTTLTHDIHVDYGGRLVIKPWPGASDHTVTLAEGVSIDIYPSSSGNNPKTWILGTESMPITLDAIDDTSEWEQVYINSGILEATYTTFRSNMVAMEQGYQGAPSLKLDHCTFESSDGYFYIQSPDIANSYIRNCIFRNLGTTYDLGSFLLLEGDIEITDSWFYNNTGSGIVLGDAGVTEISGCNVIGNDLTGLESYGLVSSVSVSCSEFSYNGGDTIPEVYMWDGTFDFSDDAGNVFSDKGGTLLEGPAMASFELDSGGNGFYLFDSTGHYIVTGDNTDTLDASGNLWFPWTPDTSIFQDYFDPDTSRYWDWTSPTASLAECGVGGMSSMPGDGPVALIRPTASTYNVPSHGKGSTKMSNTNKSVGKSFESKSANSVSFDEAVVAQKNRQYAEAKAKFASFILQNPDHPKTEAALSRFMVSAKKSGQTAGLADFFARQEASSTNTRVKRAAKFLKLNAMVMDGRKQEALDAYDDIIRNPESRHDSITAVIAATRLLFNNQTSRMSTLHPENQPANFTDMCRRVLRLIASERRTNPVLDENPVAPVVPTSYALYQNYPNPFNPSTEIRFDLPEAIRVELKIFNILGQEVTTLVDDVRHAGAYRILWDGKNANGLSVASGVFVYQLKTGNFTDAKKMVLIR